MNFFKDLNFCCFLFRNILWSMGLVSVCYVTFKFICVLRLYCIAQSDELMIVFLC